MRPLLLLTIIAGAIMVSSYSLPAHFYPLEKVITVTVNAKGQAIIGRDTLSIDDLSKELKNRLWKSYLGTGKMPDAIHIVFNGEVLMGVRGSAMDAIKDAQEKALTELCLQKYKKKYEELSSSRQNKLQHQFPVLFQQNYQTD